MGGGCRTGNLELKYHGLKYRVLTSLQYRNSFISLFIYEFDYGCFIGKWMVIHLLAFYKNGTAMLIWFNTPRITPKIYTYPPVII